ncbi:hypothetical protein JX266_009544 [Neoarthrinium moseri]|uniref:uncharacterized protein n=1 Tax=Neoarthrinium moseri TaxID=1658444 RepID=UPI001FDD4042|nr:uncharacterized protein JN550_003491 [Neoarthrinium moseri]KAI1844253.1 hypothetical protein JX266_009544 [Neoarthrinium moseri]KAI1873238.1 hypothetical protein JN550_003491 [Neoarthrinium moseri]
MFCTDNSNQSLKQTGATGSRLTAVSYSPGHSEVDLPLSSILYDNIYHKFEPVLEIYNQEFCKIPLTLDLQINPFRYGTRLNLEPLFLVHAVMALAGHHVESTRSQQRCHTALRLLRERLRTPLEPEDAYSMLAAIISLFSLDETQSALGNWRIHLSGAYALLEACGGIRRWAISARVLAQVGMLTWWDAITSLVSREDCVFPYAYFEAVLSNRNEDDLDYYSLCGCPQKLVETVMRLARLSAEKRKSSSIHDATFDNTIISDIAKVLHSWHHFPPPSAY